MDPSDRHVLTHLRELEEAAENVLSDKQEVIDLDRKRHLNREALSALDKAAKSHWKGDESRTWLTMNNCFIQMKTGSAKDLIKQDQIQLDCEINKIRSELKVKVNQLREKEGRDELKGFDLQALSKEEMGGLKQVLGQK